MNKTWSFCKIQDLMARGEAELKTGPFGTQLHASDYVDTGTPVINVRNIGFGNIKEEKVEFISEQTVQRLRSHLLEVGDIVFGRKGAVERHAFIKEKHVRWFQGSDCLRLRIKTPQVVPQFLSYYFQTEYHKQWIIKQCSHGSTMASLNQDIISRISFLLPPLPTQHKIAAILSAYDDLIENNTRRIAILEEIAQSIYQEWFVRFRYPGHEKNKMVESELGMIPEGWETVKLQEIAEVNLLSIKKGQEPEFINYVDINSVSTGYINDVEAIPFSNAPGRARRIVKHGDIIWSMVRPNRRSYSLIINPADNIIVSTGFAVISAKKVSFIYLYLAVTTDSFVNYLINHATGAAYPAVNSNDFLSAKIILPPKNLLYSFHNLVTSIFLQKHNLHQKNHVLRRTRDLLLPKLISGEIDVETLDIDTPDLGEPKEQQYEFTVARPEPIDATQLALPF